jgi:hypothetical protein
MYIDVNGKTYTFFDHAVGRMNERDISFDQVEQALAEPDDTFMLTLTRRAYDKVLDDDLEVRVIVDEVLAQIVSVYYLSDKE